MQENLISDSHNHDLDTHFQKSDFQAKLKEENRSAINKLIKICCFCFTFMTIEFVGGYIAGSLAIMSDAAHLLSDLAGFLISMFSLLMYCHISFSVQLERGKTLIDSPLFILVLKSFHISGL